jgi:hypothetical protein
MEEVASRWFGGTLGEAAAKVAAGKTVQLRPRGSSMAPKIKSGQLVTVEPVEGDTVRVGDIVLARVGGKIFLHLVSAVDRGRRRVRISNNLGKHNGWTMYSNVLGKCVAVED